jgi:hypothetical protein
MDPELERLVADMSAAQMPAPQRDSGGFENTRGNEPGTLDNGSTVIGQPFTVFSEGEEDDVQVPREVNLMDGQAETLANQTSN